MTHPRIFAVAAAALALGVALPDAAHAVRLSEHDRILTIDAIGGLFFFEPFSSEQFGIGAALAFGNGKLKPEAGFHMGFGGRAVSLWPELGVRYCIGELRGVPDDLNLYFKSNVELPLFVDPYIQGILFTGGAGADWFVSPNLGFGMFVQPIGMGGILNTLISGFAYNFKVLVHATYVF